MHCNLKTINQLNQAKNKASKMWHDHICDRWRTVPTEKSSFQSSLYTNIQLPLQLHVNAGYTSTCDLTHLDIFSLIKLVLHCSCAFSKTNNRIQNAPDVCIYFCIPLTFATFLTVSLCVCVCVSSISHSLNAFVCVPGCWRVQIFPLQVHKCLPCQMWSDQHLHRPAWPQLQR